jgi:hypothetical protein
MKKFLLLAAVLISALAIPAFAGAPVTNQCTAATADPSYSPGLNNCSSDLSGYQRVKVPSSQLITTGSAGSPSTQVISVQGVVSGTSIPVTISSNITANLAATSTGGCTPGHTLTAASTNATNITNAAATLCFISAINTTTTIEYLKLYNKASTPTCNSDTVVATYPIPPAPTSGLASGVAPSFGAFGMAFSAGVSFCVTSGIADNDNGNAVTGIAISYGTHT